MRAVTICNFLKETNILVCCHPLALVSDCPTLYRLMQDQISHYEKLCNLRKSLEMTWSRSADLKRQRDKEERNFIR